MLPPIEPEIATSNPKFDALYRDLCSNKLNSDGTSKVEPNAQKERAVLSEDLQKARIKAAKSALIKTRLQALAYQDDELPTELRELVGIITAILSAQLSAEDTILLRPDIDMFKENIAPITQAISKTVAQDLSTLSQLLPHPKTNLLSTIQKTKQSIAHSSETLNQDRLSLSHQTTALHTLYRQALETSIRILEQTLHGSMSRHARTKAEYLSTVAEGMSRKLQLQQNSLLAQTKSPEMRDVLERREEELEREALALKRKVREARELLSEYRSGTAVEVMAREYAEIEREKERVIGEIERLEKGRR